MGDSHDEVITLHGVLLSIYDTGVLLTGDSGIGKSELGLELVSRGHQLVADDSPLFKRHPGDWIEGYCPGILKDYMEIRDLGLLDVRTLFGNNAIQPATRLQLIVELVNMDPMNTVGLDRLHGSFHHRQVLDMQLSALTMSVSSTRNLSVLTETAVRLYQIKQSGQDPAQIFISRQQRKLEQQ